MNVVPTHITVADFCQGIERGEIVVNPKYQRSDKVWPQAARTFLIETILLHYPMPKFSLYQKIDLTSKKMFKEIVDGQQRSSAIFDFYKGKLELSEESDLEEFAGKSYANLDDDAKQNFLDYALNVDLIVDAKPDQVREIFRRITEPRSDVCNTPTVTFTRALERFIQAPPADVEGSTLGEALGAVFASRPASISASSRSCWAMPASPRRRSIPM